MGTTWASRCWHGMSRRAEDCRKKAMECQDRAFACADLRVRVIYFDLVGQWRQIAQEFEEIERQKELVASSVPISQKEGRP
jgi:hypothetical protein